MSQTNPASPPIVARSRFKFLEKHLKLDMAYFLSGGFWLFVGQAVAVIRALAISVFLAHNFPIADFGRFGYITAVFSLANIFGASGMSMAIFQSVARGFEGTLGYLARKIFLIGLLGTLFLAGWQLYFSLVYPDANHFVLLALGLIFPFYSVGINYVYQLSGMRQFRQRTIYELIIAVLSLALAYLTYLAWRDIYLIAIVINGTQAVLSLWYTYVLIKRANNRVDHDALAYGGKLNWNAVIPTIKGQLDRILISAFLRFEQTAIYSAAYSFSDQLTTAAKVIGTLVVPKSANLSVKEVRRRLAWRSIALFILISIVAAGVLATLMPFLIRLIYGSSYTPAVPFAIVMLLFIPLRGFSVVMRNIHESQKNTRILTFLSNQMSIIEIVLMVIGLATFELWGLVVAKIIADAISVIWQTVYLHQEKD